MAKLCLFVTDILHAGCAPAGDYDQAIGCYDKALELNPDSCDALVARGAAHANQVMRYRDGVRLRLASAHRPELTSVHRVVAPQMLHRQLSA